MARTRRWTRSATKQRKFGTTNQLISLVQVDKYNDEDREMFEVARYRAALWKFARQHTRLTETEKNLIHLMVEAQGEWVATEIKRLGWSMDHAVMAGISGFVAFGADNGVMSELREKMPAEYAALERLYRVCGKLLWDEEDKYSHVFFTSKSEGNPFAK
jgi:hypothetical protein